MITFPKDDFRPLLHLVSLGVALSEEITSAGNI
jgi:hypothetical protein